MLNKHCLSVVLSYLPMNGGANKVCKYWGNLMALNRRGLVSGCELVYREPKMSKSDIQAALFPLKQRRAEEEKAARRAKEAAINNNSKSNPAVMVGDKTKASGKATQSVKPAAEKPAGGARKPVPGDSDYDSALDSDESLDHKRPVRKPGEKAEKSAAAASSAPTATAGSKQLQQQHPENDAHLRRSNSGLSARINAGLSVSYDHMLPAEGVAPTFTTPVQQVLSPEMARKSNTNTKGTAAAAAGQSSGAAGGGMYSKSTPAPAAPAPPSHTAAAAAPGSAHPPPPPLATTERAPKATAADKAVSGKTSAPASSGNAASPSKSRLTQYIAANNDRDEDWSRNRVLEPPVVAEGKAKQARRSAGVNPDAAQKAQAAAASGVAGVSSGQPQQQQQQQQSTLATGKSARHKQSSHNNNNEAGEEEHGGRHNQRMLLQHVQKIRSEQQLNAMLEYIQAGFDKIEVLNTEKRRIKKLIRAWNASFEKKTGRLPTSTERKGHLRELYEEYQQV